MMSCGIDQHVEQMRHRRALIAADIAHARLQQRLGDGEDALAAKVVAVAEPQRLHLGLERAFHMCLASARKRDWRDQGQFDRDGSTVLAVAGIGVEDDETVRIGRVELGLVERL